MAINYKNLKSEFENLNQREAFWWFRYTHYIAELEPKPHFEQFSPSELAYDFYGTLRRVGNQYLSKEEHENGLQVWLPQGIKKGLKNVFKQNTLPEREFDWINDKNDRQIRCVWIFLNILRDEFRIDTFVQSDYQKDLGTKSCCFRPYPLKINKSSIINYFDSLNSSIDNQNKLIEALKQKWAEVDQNIQKYPEISCKWLKKSEREHIEYFLKQSESFYPTGYTSYRFWSGVPLSNLPDDDYWKILLRIQTSQLPPSEVAYMIAKQKRNWSQKKYKDTQKEKKSYNLMMDIKIQKALKTIKKHTGQSYNEIVEKLIFAEENRLTAEKNNN